MILILCSLSFCTESCALGLWVDYTFAAASGLDHDRQKPTRYLIANTKTRAQTSQFAPRQLLEHRRHAAGSRLVIEPENKCIRRSAFRRDHESVAAPGRLVIMLHLTDMLSACAEPRAGIGSESPMCSEAGR